MARQSQLLEILEAGVDSVRPSILFPPLIEKRQPVVESWLEDDNRSLLAIGKASVDSAKAILDKTKCATYFVLSPYPDPENRLQVHVGTHPIPDEKSYNATSELLDWMRNLPGGELLVVLSGGSSALCVRPVPTVSLRSKMRINDLLLRSGASIHEINSVRKHLSAVKGGQLASQVLQGQTKVLVISDVIGNDLSVIGSGLFYPDPSTFLDARTVLLRYNLWDEIDADVRHTIEAGSQGLLPETPKPGSLRVEHTILASNEIAREAAAESARSAGFQVRQIKTPIQGDVRDAADELSNELQHMINGSALIAGGEVTVRLSGSGMGGRNQHLALLMAEKLAGKTALFAALGTDGIDGNSTAAGAWVDGETLQKAGKESFLHALKNCDSYRFFQNLDQNLVTGPTGTNVMDLYIGLKL